MSNYVDSIITLFRFVTQAVNVAVLKYLKHIDVLVSQLINVKSTDRLCVDKICQNRLLVDATFKH